MSKTYGWSGLYPGNIKVAWKTKSICRALLYESCDITGQGNTKNGETLRFYHNKRNHTNFKNTEFREKSILIMNEFYDYMSSDIQMWPMFGTLLGIVRSNDLIPHDDDVDFGYFKKDEAKVIEKLDILHNQGDFKVIRNEFNNLYTIYKDDVFIDMYEYEVLDNDDFVKQGHRAAYDITKDELYPMKKIFFKGKEFDCMANPIKFFERYYGKDWQTPK